MKGLHVLVVTNYQLQENLRKRRDYDVIIIYAWNSLGFQRERQYCSSTLLSNTKGLVQHMFTSQLKFTGYTKTH